jgi:hypothetical protein
MRHLNRGEKSGPKVWATFVVKKTSDIKLSHNWRKFAESGHPGCKQAMSAAIGKQDKF